MLLKSYRAGAIDSRAGRVLDQFFLQPSTEIPKVCNTFRKWAVHLNYLSYGSPPKVYRHSFIHQSMACFIKLYWCLWNIFNHPKEKIKAFHMLQPFPNSQKSDSFLKYLSDRSLLTNSNITHYLCLEPTHVS